MSKINDAFHNYYFKLLKSRKIVNYRTVSSKPEVKIAFISEERLCQLFGQTGLWKRFGCIEINVGILKNYQKIQIKEFFIYQSSTICKRKIFKTIVNNFATFQQFKKIIMKSIIYF